jgi:DNA helicase-2/ATP-dependent DNA helicase PcrA
MPTDFTDEQKEVIGHHPDRHARVLAGPGTGKSSTVIGLADRLRNDGYAGVRLVTFTRSASRELASKLLESGLQGLATSTIHSFAIALLLRNPGTGNFPAPLRMADDWEWKKLIRPLFTRRLGLVGQQYRLVDEFKVEMASHWESLDRYESPKITPALRPRFVGEWQRQRNLIGYSLVSEIPYRLLEALRSHADLDIGDLQMLIVDEYQDLNACDLACLQKLSERGVTLVAVGDDDQSIYWFRKAHPIGIRDFPALYGSADYPLTINHRCAQKILDWATYVIQQDADRVARPALRPGATNPEGCVGLLEFNRENDEGAGVVRLIRWLHDREHVDLAEILLLYRSDKIAGPVRQALETAEIPFADPDALKEHLHTDDARILLATLHLLVEPEDSLAWWTLLYLTPRVTQDHLMRLMESAEASNERLGHHIHTRRLAGTLESLIGQAGARMVDRFRAREVIKIPEQAPWGVWITEQVQGGILPVASTELLEILRGIDDLLQDSRRLDRYLGQIEPLTKDLATKRTPDAIRLMSIAGSKGLTTRACIVIGCENDVIPHPKGLLAEERRLLYVAMTRAADYLFLTRARRRIGMTAWVGSGRVAAGRPLCQFLEGGPVTPTDGPTYLDGLGA